MMYCEKCGSELILTRHRYKFDKETGEVIYEWRKRCPKSLTFWIDLGHTHGYASSPDGYYTEPSESCF